MRRKRAQNYSHGSASRDFRMPSFLCSPYRSSFFSLFDSLHSAHSAPDGTTEIHNFLMLFCSHSWTQEWNKRFVCGSKWIFMEKAPLLRVHRLFIYTLFFHLRFKDSRRCIQTYSHWLRFLVLNDYRSVYVCDDFFLFFGMSKTRNSRFFMLCWA